MALQSYRTEVGNGAYVNTDYFMNVTGEAGYVVVFDTSNSGVGASADDAGAIVKFSSSPFSSGDVPAGILLMDVVNKDLAHTHLNQHKREGQVGGKVALLRRGVVVTNAITGGVNPVAGNPAYAANLGYISTSNNVSSTAPRVGTFLGSRDTNGYVKVDVNI